jgi:hypothetical protein
MLEKSASNAMIALVSAETADFTLKKNLISSSIDQDQPLGQNERNMKRTSGTKKLGKQRHNAQHAQTLFLVGPQGRNYFF